MLRRRHWIPPAALSYAQLAHGFAWALLLWIAWSGNLAVPPYGFAWIHAVALGWVTMAALAILLHALPSFTDTDWRGQTVARWSLVVYGVGVALLLGAFLGSPALLGAAGTVLLAALVVYLSTAFATIAAAMNAQNGAVQRAVARAFGGTFTFLLLAALAGFGLAWLLAGARVPPFLAFLPAPHADLGALGWLTLLIYGVSRRTLRPITGEMTRMRWMHIAIGVLALAGVPLLCAGVGARLTWLAWLGGSLFAASAAGFAIDTLDVIRRARNPHRPPQAFIVAAICWFVVALVLGAGILAGKPWQEAYVFALLMGWIGQFVNAHLYHIGIRLLATVYRGEDDETPPEDLLETRLSWFSFFAFQAAIAAVVYGLLSSDPALVARAAIFGITGWIAMVANVAAARARARAQIQSRPIR